MGRPFGAPRTAWSTHAHKVVIKDGATGIKVNADKFSVDTDGNTVVAGTVSVAQDVSVNTDKFTVTAADGNVNAQGTVHASGVTSVTVTESDATGVTQALKLSRSWC